MNVTVTADVPVTSVNPFASAIAFPAASTNANADVFDPPVDEIEIVTLALPATVNSKAPPLFFATSIA